MDWSISNSGHRGLSVYASSPELFDLGADNLNTFHRILSSIVQKNGFDLFEQREVKGPMNKSLSPLSSINPVQVVEQDSHDYAYAQILTFSKPLSKRMLQLYKVSMSFHTKDARVVHASDMNASLLVNIVHRFSDSINDEAFLSIRELDALIQMLEKAIRDTLTNLNLRGTLKASREDLIAQLVSPGKIRGSALALQGLQTRSGARTTTPTEASLANAYETVIENYLPDNSMYQNFNMKGGKGKKKSAKRSKKVCKQR